MAPIAYLRENNAAIVACNDLEIEKMLNFICSDCAILKRCATNGALLGLKNHNRETIEKIFYETMFEVLLKE